MVVPIPEPSTPNRGNGPMPKINKGFRKMLTMLAIHRTRMASAASPAPRNTALTRNSIMTAALPPKIIRV